MDATIAIELLQTGTDQFLLAAQRYRRMASFVSPVCSDDIPLQLRLILAGRKESPTTRNASQWIMRQHREARREMQEGAAAVYEAAGNVGQEYAELCSQLIRLALDIYDRLPTAIGPVEQAEVDLRIAEFRELVLDAGSIIPAKGTEAAADGELTGGDGAETTLVEFDHPGFLKNDLQTIVDVSDEAMRKFIIESGVPRAGQGQKNFRYPLRDAVKIIQTARERTQDSVARHKCCEWLRQNNHNKTTT